MSVRRPKVQLDTEENLRALVSLLDDRDPKVAETCLARVRELREGAIPFLRDALTAARSTLRDAAASALSQVGTDIADQRFLDFASASADALDLEQGALLLSSTAEPDVDPDQVRAQLDELARRVDERVSRATGARQMVAVFGAVLGREFGLRGDERTYYDPRNSFVHCVLERKLGIPISLSAIYLMVARRVGVTMHGVGMPGHFLLQYGERGDGRIFLDPFRGGAVITRADCGTMLVRQGLDDSDELLPVLPDRNILARMIANLLNIFRRGNDSERAARYERMFLRVRGGAESL